MLAESTDKKILPLADLAPVVAALKRRSLRIVHCHGVFDLLHPGHIKHFEAAKRLGDVLVVTLTRDEFVNKGPGRPVFNQRLRAESIAALACVDYVAINDWPSATQTIQLLRPDVYVKGGDYADAARDLTGGIAEEAEAVRSIGGSVHFTDEETFSSTQLLNALFPVYPPDAEQFLRSFRERYSPSEVVARLQALRRLRVLVIGEAIIDQYQYCSPLGKSPKDTFIVAKSLDEETFAGGSLAVANHVAGFCDAVDLVTYIGGDSSWVDFATAHLRPNVNATILRAPAAKTIIKRRFVEPTFMKKLFEVCDFDDVALLDAVRQQLHAVLAERISGYDLVLVSDFGHGMIDADGAGVIARGSRFVAVNAQTNSQNAGYNLITKYPEASYICVDEPEIRLAAVDRVSALPDLVRTIAARLNCERLSITRGSRGAAAYSTSSGYFEVPVFSQKVVDTVGAGDAYLAVTSLCAAGDLPMDLLAFVGNVVGAQAVQIVGNRSAIDPVMLYKSINAILG